MGEHVAKKPVDCGCSEGDDVATATRRTTELIEELESMGMDGQDIAVGIIRAVRANFEDSVSDLDPRKAVLDRELMFEFFGYDHKRLKREGGA